VKWRCEYGAMREVLGQALAAGEIRAALGVGSHRASWCAVSERGNGVAVAKVANFEPI
jgi:hypothetical protein